MEISYFGFNVQQKGECVTFSSAPGTGASLVANGFSASADNKHFCVTMKIDGTDDSDTLKIVFNNTYKCALPIMKGVMYRYEVTVPSNVGEIKEITVAPSSKECMITVKELEISQ